LTSEKPARTKAGGYVRAAELERGAGGRALCRWCGKEVGKGRRTFCADDCVHQWKLRTNAAYLREKVFERDRGVCAQCGADTVAVRKELRKLDYAARRQFLKVWRLRERSRKSLWDATFRICAHFACSVTARRQQRYGNVYCELFLE
jgi:hypothetical protein